jgi:Sec-independent protein translocase protein TatA
VAVSLAPPLALFSSLAISEIVLIGAVALMIFGGRLPEVVMRGAAQLMRARKVVTRMWREAGLEQELRRVQWEIERNLPRDADFELRSPNSKQLKAPVVRPAGNPAYADARGDEERLDPMPGFGAPAGTIAVAAPGAERREPDPAPRAPDPAPRDDEQHPASQGDETLTTHDRP